MSYSVKTCGGVQYVAFDSLAHVRHGFSMRTGGVSQGHCESLNFTLNTGDTEENVRRNYEIFAEALGVLPGSLCLSKQVHDTEIMMVDSDLAGNGIYKPQQFISCDGLITGDPDVALVTFYADCCPIMVATPDGAVVGAAHGGWRGTAAGIGPKLAENMSDICGYPMGEMKAAIGPCIGMCCFETHSDVPDTMRHQLGSMVDNFIHPRGDGKYNVNLLEINRELLLSAGIRQENISLCDLCTCCNEDKFFSHRRNGLSRGSMIAVIAPNN